MRCPRGLAGFPALEVRLNPHGNQAEQIIKNWRSGRLFYRVDTPSKVDLLEQGSITRAEIVPLA